MIRRTCGCFQPQRGRCNRPSPRTAGSRNIHCSTPATSTAQPIAMIGTCSRGASHSAPRIMQILRITGASAGSAKWWKLFNTPADSAFNDTKKMNGKVSRTRSVVRSNLCGLSSAPGANIEATCGAKIMPSAVTSSSTPLSVPDTRASSSFSSSREPVCLTSVNTGTNAVENDPSANRRRMKLGMRKAMTKASVAALAPNTWLIEMSRIRPRTRETIVMLLNDSSPRSMLGDFMRVTLPL